MYKNYKLATEDRIAALEQFVRDLREEAAKCSEDRTILHNRIHEIQTKMVNQAIDYINSHTVAMEKLQQQLMKNNES